MTGLISTSGSQFQDWSAPYRLFSHLRIDPAALFSGIRSAYLQQLPATAPLCISIDDSLLPKTGTKIPGVAWRRDPQGPPFQTNLIRAQRVLQFSALLPLPNSSAVRGIPIQFLHTPTPPKLPAKASAEQIKEHGALSDAMNLSTRALDQIRSMQAGFGNRRPILLTDARFTTHRFLKGLPDKVTLIGRVRKDAKLFYAPGEQPARGRRRVYGPQCPTPDEIRNSDLVPWQTIRIHAAGADHDCRVKVVTNLRWVPAGPRPLCLIIIAPLAYRSRKGARLLYRDPAFLICTDLELALAEAVQFYFWRWDIEVNFREEKTLLGVGEAQVRNTHSCESLPAFQVAAYSLLLLAAARAGTVDLMPPPKWRAHHKPERISTPVLLRTLRSEVWGRGLGLWNFSGFCSVEAAAQNPEKLAAALPSAVLYT
jgi:hypothetical protein